MTHSVGRQSGAPFVSGPGATNNVTNNFTGGPWTFIRTHVDSSAETLATWRLDEDTSASLVFANASASNTVFQPQIVGTATGTRSALETRGVITTDTGTAPAMWWNVKTAGGAAVTTRPIYEWDNNSASILQLLPLNSGANAALSWGTQTGAAPTFTTRNAGNRLILYSAISGSNVDHAIGVEGTSVLWQSVPAATSSFHFGWYAGTTRIADLRGDGIFNVGSSTFSSRLGQKLETNTSANWGGAALITWSATAANDSILELARSKSSTIGTHTVVASGDGLGEIAFRGSDGTVFRDAATIASSVDGTPGSGDMPGRLTFWTTPDGSATLAERMRITNAGDTGVGKTPTTGIILDVNGQLGLKSYTVATLPSASVQAGAIVYASDADGNGPCLVISNGTNWKRCDDTSTTVS